MAEAISQLISDEEGGVVQVRTVVIHAPAGRGRKRFSENCVTVHASEESARAAANPAAGDYAAMASGPSRSSEGIRLYYLLRWLD